MQYKRWLLSKQNKAFKEKTFKYQETISFVEQKHSNINKQCHFEALLMAKLYVIC